MIIIVILVAFAILIAYVRAQPGNSSSTPKLKLHLKEKIRGYQSATIIRFALLEGPALFAIVAFILSWNMLFLIIAGALIVYFSFLKPTKPRTETNLKLSNEEKLVFDREDEVLE